MKEKIKRTKIKRTKILNNLPLVVTTVALVIVTGIYTFFTWRMGETMKGQFNISYEQYQQTNRPYLFTDDFKWELSKGETVFSVYLKNSGDIPARIEIEKAFYALDDKEYHIEPLYQDDMFVFPNHSRGIRTKEISKELLDLIPLRESFELILKINYWKIGDEKKENTFFYEEHRKLTKNLDDSLDFESSIIYINAN